jgi:hypothetical protein
LSKREDFIHPVVENRKFCHEMVTRNLKIDPSEIKISLREINVIVLLDFAPVYY